MYYWSCPGGVDSTVTDQNNAEGQAERGRHQVPQTSLGGPAPSGRPSQSGQQSASAEVAYGGPGTGVCPVCGTSNAPAARHCVKCWATLAQQAPAGSVQGSSGDGRPPARAVRSRLLRYGLGLLALAVVAVAVTYYLVGKAPILPAPTSSLNSASAPGRWSMFGGDPLHTNVAPQAQPIQGRLRWSFATDGPLGASPIVADGRLYLSTQDGRILALEAGTGRLVWEYRATGPVDATPAVAGDLVYVGLRDSRLLALDAATGALRWEFDTDNPIFAGVQVVGGELYLGSTDGKLYSLDARTGRRRWAYQVGGWTTSPPAVVGDVVVVMSQEGKFHVVDRRTGKQRLFHEIASGGAGSAAIAGDRAVIGTADGRLRAIDWRARQYPFERTARYWQLQFFIWQLVQAPPVPKGFLWVIRFPSTSIAATPAVLGDTVYIGTTDGKLHAVAASDGRQLGEFGVGGAIRSAAVVGGDTLYVGAADGKLHALDVATLREKWSFATKGPIAAAPALAGDMLYLASEDGALYALE